MFLYYEGRKKVYHHLEQLQYYEKVGKQYKFNGQLKEVCFAISKVSNGDFNNCFTKLIQKFGKSILLVEQLKKITLETQTNATYYMRIKWSDGKIYQMKNFPLCTYKGSLWHESNGNFRYEWTKFLYVEIIPCFYGSPLKNFILETLECMKKKNINGGLMLIKN